MLQCSFQTYTHSHSAQFVGRYLTVKLILSLFAAMVIVGCGGQGEVEIPENPKPLPPPDSMSTADEADGGETSLGVE